MLESSDAIVLYVCDVLGAVSYLHVGMRSRLSMETSLPMSSPHNLKPYILPSLGGDAGSSSPQKMDACLGMCCPRATKHM